MKVFKLISGYDSTTILIGPDISNDKFIAICKEMAQKAAVNVMEESTEYISYFVIEEEMIRLLKTVGFEEPQNIAGFNLENPSFRHKKETIECYGNDIGKALIQKTKEHDEKQITEYESKKKIKQTIPTEILCEDAICKNCGKDITRPVPEHDAYTSTMLDSRWNHVRDRYAAKACSEAVAEPIQDSIVQKLHKYVETDFPSHHRVE